MKSLLCESYKPNSLFQLSLPDDLEETIRMIAISANLNVLIVGDSGSGKTSLVDILSSSFQSSDGKDKILHISSLQDQGISFYRTEVRTFCQTPCISGKKLLIIDDLDTVSDQSQQVFRNCIDKFSHNVQFIATCTNIYRIIDSLQSRITLIRIPPTTSLLLTKLAKRVCKEENIQISQQALSYVVSLSENSIRNLFGYLEKFALIDERITYKVVVDSCTNIPHSTIETYIQMCKSGNLIEAVNILNGHASFGFSVMDILDTLCQFARMTTSIDDSQRYKLIPILCKYVSIFHNIHEDEIELVFMTADIIKVYTRQELSLHALL